MQQCSQPIRLAECFKYSCVFSTRVLLSLKKKCLRCFSHYQLDICLVTHEQADPVPQRGDYRGLAFNSHVTDKENIWNISFPSFELQEHATEGLIFISRLASVCLPSSSYYLQSNCLLKPPLHSMKRRTCFLIYLFPIVV